MAADNVDLCDKLLTLGKVDARKAATVGWEREFQPLAWKAVQEEWLRLVKSNAVDPSNGEGERLSHLVYRACDRGLLGYDGIENGVPRAVYPYSMMQVATSRTGLSTLEAFCATWDQDAREMTQVLLPVAVELITARAGMR
jgi:hypothetical protein